MQVPAPTTPVTVAAVQASPRWAVPPGGEQRDQILVRMTHRHLAIFRTRVKP